MATNPKSAPSEMHDPQPPAEASLVPAAELAAIREPEAAAPPAAGDATQQVVAVPAAVALPSQLDPMYEVLTDTWGARAPIYRKGDTFLASMLADRDLVWAEQHFVIARIGSGDPRLSGAPTGPSGDQAGVPTDGWYTPMTPMQQPANMVNQIAVAMRANGATEQQIASVIAQVGTTLPLTVGAPVIGSGRIMAPQPGQAHIEVPSGV